MTRRLLLTLSLFSLLMVASERVWSQGTVMPAPLFTAYDSNGDPIVGGKLCVFAAGTSTPATTYSDSALSSANTNPVILDVAGRAVVYLTPGLAYKFTLRTAGSDATCNTGTVIWTQDNVAATPIASTSTDATGTAGEDIAIRDAIYVADGTGGTTAGRWYKVDADTAAQSLSAGTVGVATAAISSGASSTAIRIAGRVTGYTGLTAGAVYYASSTAGGITNSAPTLARQIGTADSTTSIVVDGNPRPPLVFSSITSRDTIYSLGVAAIGGTPPQADNGLILRPTYAGSGTTQRGLYSNPTFNASATLTAQAVTAQPATAAASFTLTDLIGLYAIDATKGAGSTITNQYGLKIENQTQGTNNFAIKTGTGSHQFGANTIQTLTSASITTDGNVTYTAAQMLGGRIVRSGLSANRTDAVDTAANIVAAIPGAAVGMSFQFLLDNSDDASTIDFSGASTGVTYRPPLNGVASLAAAHAGLVTVVLTNVSGGSEAVTVYVS